MGKVLPRFFSLSVVGLPQLTLFNFCSKAVFGGLLLSLLFFKESLLRGEFALGLLKVGTGGGKSGRNHCLCTFEVVNQPVELLDGSLFVISILYQRSLKRVKKLLHLVDNDVQSLRVDSGSNFHERSDWVSFTDFKLLVTNYETQV